MPTHSEHSHHQKPCPLILSSSQTKGFLKGLLERIPFGKKRGGGDTFWRKKRGPTVQHPSLAPEFGTPTFCLEKKSQCRGLCQILLKRFLLKQSLQLEVKEIRTKLDLFKFLEVCTYCTSTHCFFPRFMTFAPFTVAFSVTPVPHLQSLRSRSPYTCLKLLLKL